METNLLKEIEELTRIKAKYENQRGRYMEYAKKLKTASELLLEVANDIDPYLNTHTEEKVRAKHGALKEVKAEVVEKLQCGVEVGTDFLVKAYPDLNISQIRSILKDVRGMKGVHSRKDGAKVFFFYSKDWKVI